MKPQDHDKKLDELLTTAIGGEEPRFDFNKWKNAHQSEIEQYQTQSAGAKTPKPSNIWRKIMQSRITKLATAAAVIVGFLLCLKYYTGSIDMATPAFAEIADNVLKQKWVYMFEEDRKTGQIQAEYWYNPKEQKIFFKSHTGNAAFKLDLVMREKTEFRDDTITISSLGDFEQANDWLIQRLPMISGLLSRYEGTGAEIVERDAVYNSKPASLYEIDLTLPQGSSYRTKENVWLVDRTTQLPIICEYKDIYSSETSGKMKDTLISSSRYAFDYSDTGPTDIYSLGVPPDANVVNYRPSDEIQDLIDKINQVKASKYNSYAVLIREGDRLREFVAKDGLNFRRDHLELGNNGSDWESKKGLYLEEMGDTFASIKRWIDETKAVKSTYITLGDGRLTYEMTSFDISKNKSMRVEYRRGGSDEFIQYCWRSKPSGKIVTTDYSKEHGLICTENKWRYDYFDPAKDYLWVRSESKNNRPAGEVVEFAQTESGMWYPNKIRVTYSRGTSNSDEVTYHSEFVYIYASDMNPEIAKEIDPRSFPNYVDPRELTRQMKQGQSEDPNDRPVEYTGFTPLHMAVYRGDIQLVKKYLAEGAQVEPVYDSGATPMELAVASGNLEMVKLLFKHGADFVSNDSEKRSALGLAVKQGHHEIAEFIRANTSDVNTVYKAGETALHYSAENGDLKEVKQLLTNGARVDPIDEQGRTPLCRSVIAMGVKLYNPVPTKKETIQNYKDVIKFLIENGADINARDNSKYPVFTGVLMRVVHGKRNAAQQIDFLEFLLEFGPDLNLDVELGINSSLGRTVSERRYDILEVLLKGGFDPWLYSASGFNQPKRHLLNYARRMKDNELYDLLYPYMKERYERTNAELMDLTAKIVRACLDGDMTAIDSMCINTRRHHYGWKTWPEEIKKLYQGNEALFDQMIPGWFTLDGFGEVYIPLPKGVKGESALFGFAHCPDGTWKCVEFSKCGFMPQYEGVYQGDFIHVSMFLDEFKNYLYDQAGMDEKVPTSEQGDSMMHGRFSGRRIITVTDGSLRVNYDSKNQQNFYMLLTADRIKEYSGNNLRVYTKERVSKQKDYPEKLIFRPGTFIVDTGQDKYIFTISDGQVLLTHGQTSEIADKFIFDLETYSVVESE